MTQWIDWSACGPDATLSENYEELDFCVVEEGSRFMMISKTHDSLAGLLHEPSHLLS